MAPSWSQLNIPLCYLHLCEIRGRASERGSERALLAASKGRHNGRVRRVEGGGSEGRKEGRKYAEGGGNEYSTDSGRGREGGKDEAGGRADGNCTQALMGCDIRVALPPNAKTEHGRRSQGDPRKSFKGRARAHRREEPRTSMDIFQNRHSLVSGHYQNRHEEGTGNAIRCAPRVRWNRHH